MSTKHFVLQIIILVLLSPHHLFAAQTTPYRNLPPLYSLHDYDDCFSRQPSSIYCLLFAEIVPNRSSSLWASIDIISNDTFNRFRHDRLFFGICLEQCKEILHNSKYFDQNDQLARNATIKNEIIDYYERIREGYITDRRLLYHRTLDQCVNYEFQQKYNLSLKTYTEYCDENQNSPDQNGYMTNIFYASLTFIIAVVASSSIYDYRLKCQQPIGGQNKDFYVEEHTNLGPSVLTSFSLYRNYNRITKRIRNDSEKDLQFSYTFRVFTMFVVILGHVLTIITTVPVKNTEFIEYHYDRADAIIFQNGSALIQIFFVLTGFLLKLNFNRKQLIMTDSSYMMCCFIYMICFLNRYLRILPSLGILIFFNSSLLLHFGNGPFWRHISEGERVFCSKYWWKNLLMINNFMMQDSCAHHTWYLAADMQLYELYLIVIIVTTRNPRTKKPLYVIIGILAFVVPGFLTYFRNLDAFTYLKPESYRYFYFKDVDTLYTTYVPFYCNLGGYLIGLLCAEIYQNYIWGRSDAPYIKYRKNSKVQIALLAFILFFGFGLLFSGLLVIKAGIEKPSLWIALYAGCYRNLWAVLGGFVLVCMLLKFGGIAYTISCLPVFQVLGRLTFQMYIWHTTVLRILFGFYRAPLFLSDFFVLCQIVIAFILTSLVAFLMALFVEYPMGHVVTCLFKQTRNKIDNNNDRTNELQHFN